jgi:hypothetical protein
MSGLAGFSALPFRVSGPGSVDAWTFEWTSRSTEPAFPPDGGRVRIRCNWLGGQAQPGETGYQEAISLMRRLVEGSRLECQVLVIERFERLADDRLDYPHAINCRVRLGDGRDLGSVLNTLYRDLALGRALAHAPADLEVPIPQFLLRR